MGKKKNSYVYDAASSGFSYAIDDIKRAFIRPKLTLTLIKSSFLSKYRGTVFGGLWITLTTLMMVTGLAILYGQIFGSPLESYFPFVAIGIIVWGLISTLINQGATIFLVSSTAYNQTPIPKSIFVLRLLGVTFITFLFKLVVLIGVVFYVGLTPSILSILLSLLGILLIFWNGFWFALIVGTIGTRFRDINQLVDAGLTIAFFLTPVFWTPDRLGPYKVFVEYNPLYHYLNVVRGPLIGSEDVVVSFVWVGILSVVVTSIGFLIYGKFARYLSYWN